MKGVRSRERRGGEATKNVTLRDDVEKVIAKKPTKSMRKMAEGVGHEQQKCAEH